MTLKEKKNILVLDGGGFRGLSSLLVIDEITQAASTRARKPLRPYEIFDLICGTGVGGIIAILLGRMRLDCHSATEEYKKLTTSFCGNDEAELWKQILEGASVDCSLYEEALKQLCVNQSVSLDARMAVSKEASEMECYTFVNVVSDAPYYTNMTYQVRTYATPGSALVSPPADHEWMIREAARATSASPIYMTPLLLDNNFGYRDAGFSGYNNPIHLALREFEWLWYGEKIGSIISLGTDISTLLPSNVTPNWAPTNLYASKFVNDILDKLPHSSEKGHFRKDAISLAKQLIDIANDSQTSHSEAESKSSTQGAYFRVDPPNGLKSVDLFDCFDTDAVENAMEYWMSTNGQAIIDAISKSVVNENSGALDRENAVNMEPPKPPAGTVNPDYHPQLDKKRPGTMMEYLHNYDVLFVVDDSNSMNKGNRWHETRDALGAIAEHALNFNADTVALEFLNSPEEFVNIKGHDKIISIFNQVKIKRGTPTGAKLERILKRQIKGLDDAIGTPLYMEIRPLDIIVLTDGVPSDKPQNVLSNAVKHMRANKHHPNCIGIQFVQIGDERGAAKELKKLIYGDNGSMVDTVPYTEALTPERLERILLGGLHPNIRAMLH